MLIYLLELKALKIGIIGINQGILEGYKYGD
jgi:hypothetical protein